MRTIESSGQSKVLNSWKEIAAYLDRGVRTVQRWHMSYGLPVRRIGNSLRSPVFAFSGEVDDWLRQCASDPGRNLERIPCVPLAESGTELDLPLKKTSIVSAVARKRTADLKVLTSQVMFRFLIGQLDLGLKFARYAGLPYMPIEKRAGYELLARRAYEAACAFQRQTELDPSQWKQVQEEIEQLRSILQQLGIEEHRNSQRSLGVANVPQNVIEFPAATRHILAPQ